MADYVLETKNLGISFGGLKAVQDVNLKIKKGQILVLLALTVPVKRRFLTSSQVFTGRQRAHFTLTVRI